jgi:hypothetical protein
METEMKNKRSFLIPVVFILLGILAATAGVQEDMDQFFKAKELVFKRDWPAARAGFESYLKAFPQGRMRDEAHFWLAQSFDNLARDERGRDAVVRLKIAALEEIRKLVDGYPESLWRDDALAFRIEIAGELVLLGEESYQKDITEAVASRGRSSRDLKIQALSSLVNLDPATALPILERALKTDEDSVVRQRCLSLLLMLPASDAEKALGEAARSDRDEKIRAEAATLLEQLRTSRLPFKLRYFIYGSKLHDGSLDSALPEGKAREYSLGRSSAGDAEAVLDKVHEVLGNKISTPLSSANGQLPITPYFSRTSVTTHRAGDYWIRINDSELKVTPDRITGRIEFRNRATNDTFDRTFSVDRSADKLLVVRSGNSLSLLMFQFAEPGSERASLGNVVEKAGKALRDLKPGGYGDLKASSVISLPPGITVRTERMSYDLHSFDKNLIALEMGKAVIYPGHAPNPAEEARNVLVEVAGVPGSGSLSREPWTLIGDLFYFKDPAKLVGFGAYLINPGNEVVAEGLIEVPAGDPAAFKVLAGRAADKNRRIVTGRDEERTRPIFTTLWSNYLDWAVLTTRSSTSSARDSEKMDFGLAQATRTVGGRDWILIGQILALGKERKFIARQAALIASDGTIVHGAEIRVNADDPADCQVVVKRP